MLGENIFTRFFSLSNDRTTAECYIVVSRTLIYLVCLELWSSDFALLHMGKKVVSSQKVMSLESSLTGAEEFKFEHERNVEVQSWREGSLSELCSLKLY